MIIEGRKRRIPKRRIVKGSGFSDVHLTLSADEFLFALTACSCHQAMKTAEFYGRSGSRKSVIAKLMSECLRTVADRYPEWRPVTNDEGKAVVSSNGVLFFVSREGKVARLDAIGELVLVPLCSGSGFRTVRLDDRGKPFRLRIDRAVCEAFIGACPIGYHVAHKDGNRRNDELENLFYEPGPTARKAVQKDSTRRESVGEVDGVGKEEEKALEQAGWRFIHSPRGGVAISYWGRRYLVNDRGEVISISQTGGDVHRLRPDQSGLLSIPNASGFFDVKVYRLVYETFVGKLNDGDTVRSLDKDRRNNCVENLYRYNSKGWRSRAVTCLETGRIFTSVLQASKTLVLRRADVRDSASSFGVLPAGEFHFVFS